MFELKCGNYVLKLEQDDNKLIGCCPFHEEKTPSFFIEPARDRFRCLGCGRKGGWLELLRQLSLKSDVKEKHVPLLANAKRVPPHSVEAEQAVIGGLLIDNEAWDQVVECITETDFYRHEHRILIRAMTELVLQSMPLDIVTVTEALESTQELRVIGGVAYVAELAKNTPVGANVEAYANIVRERSILRQLIDVGGKISESAFKAAMSKRIDIRQTD